MATRVGGGAGAGLGGAVFNYQGHIEIENSTPQTTEFLKKLPLPASVDVEIKV